jgi:hypothetical protein
MDGSNMRRRKFGAEIVILAFSQKVQDDEQGKKPEASGLKYRIITKSIEVQQTA